MHWKYYEVVMIFNVREKELLLRLISVEQSRLAVSIGDSYEEDNVNNNDSVIQIYETIKKKSYRSNEHLRFNCRTSKKN